MLKIKHDVIGNLARGFGLDGDRHVAEADADLRRQLALMVPPERVEIELERVLTLAYGGKSEAHYE